MAKFNVFTMQSRYGGRGSRERKRRCVSGNRGTEQHVYMPPMSFSTGSLSKTRDGMALLMCLFVIGITSILTLGILETILVQQTAIRHSVDHDRAFYLAEAGTNHVLAELEANAAWRGALGPIEFPSQSGDFYSATAIDGAASSVTITAQGRSAGAVHRIQVTIQP